MKVVKRTADYTVYQKRSERYAVQGPDKARINGYDKAKILLDEGLIKAVLSKPEPEPEPAAEEAAAAEDAPEAAAEETEAAAEEAPEAEKAADKEDAPEGE